MVKGGTVHDFRIDQGKVMSLRPGAVELLERDGTREVIAVAATAQVFLNGRLTQLGLVPLRTNAITIRDGDQPATTVRVTGVGKK